MAPRRRRDDDRGFLRFDVHGQRPDDLLQSGRLRDLLSHARIEVTAFAEQPPLSARIAQFSDVTLGHARMAGFRGSWDRVAASSDRALILLVKQGSLRVTGPDGTVRAGGGAFLLFPGLGPITAESADELTDVTYLTFPARLTAVWPEPGSASLVHSEELGIPAAAFAPAAAFVASVCALSIADVPEGGPLQSVAEEVARSVVELCAGARGRASESLYGAAMTMIRRSYDAPSLNGEAIAAALGVSVRTLQGAFQSEGRTVAGVIRQVRAVAAVQLRHEQPGISQARIAALTGFGSVDSLQRAVSLGVAEHATPGAAEHATLGAAEAVSPVPETPGVR
ncbi:helix-turn-helix domain-containing protein [Leucobacter luti]|uniref:AraC-like DNA-binding protein n=1 Tax=Leucobacter luti TaxID=340320 RepID=A0A4Q7U162_9MICO|nr:helix-turn-helix domain-containing protein [Leucobacter luti]RZT67146.1 AraC-like DNA-binding protein [Leucobacter luti]